MLPYQQQCERLLGQGSFLKQNITGIQSNTKHLEKGNIFVAINGTAVDGHLFIDDAISKGASAIVGEKDLHGLPIPYYKVDNSRKALGQLAAKFYGHPSEKHSIIAITGTNGKTTTAYLIKHIIEQCGERCSMFGTVAHYVNGEKLAATTTTPDATLLQKLLHESDDRYVVMEASSHGIHQHRLEGTGLDYGLFTNLSHDHLDYHGDLNSYFLVKSELFHLLKRNGEAVIGSYTPWGSNLKTILNKQTKRVFSFGEKDTDDVELINIERLDKPTFHIKDMQNKYTLYCPLPGIHNVWNTMQAYLTARRIGIEPEDIIKSLITFQGVPGRLEQFFYPNKATFIVDYAHTPDALQYCLTTIKKISTGKLIHIFGFRGKRDREKRAKMLEVSLKNSDLTIITLDDLNGEDFEEMQFQVNVLVNQFSSNHCKVIFDRTEAIKYAWEHAHPEDAVVITGKGPEQYQQSFNLPSTTDSETIHYLRCHI